GGGRGGRGARDRRAGDVARFRRAGARRRRHGRDRAPGECRGLETRRRGGHRRGGYPRGRYRVPHGRRAVAAAAGIGRGRRAQRGGHRTRPAGAAGGRRVTTPARLRIAGGTVYDPAHGVDGAVRGRFAAGYRYAGLGYTTAMEAAVAPLAARQAHAELDDTPLIDSGFFVLLGNDDYLLRQIAAGETARARDYAAWLLGVTRAYAIKIVNPGGVALWKGGGGTRNVSGLDDAVGSSAVTPRKILETL